MSGNQEFIVEKEYELLTEATYLDKSGVAKKTKKVRLIALKIQDGEEIHKILSKEEGVSKALEVLTSNQYIVPLNEEGKLISSSLHFRTATQLFMEYSNSFF